MEPVCPACGGRLLAWRHARSAEPAIDARYLLERCERCGTAASTGPPAQELHDAGAYAASRPRGARLVAPILAAFDRRRLSLLRRAMPPPARLLDVGAGRGRFVAAAGAAGYDASGIEPSARGVEAGSRDYGVTLTRATIEAADVAPASLDALSVWHVLEHVDDPGAALERITSWLRPDGVLLLGVPNLASLQARIGGERWYHLDLPRHRTHFTPAGVGALLASHGYAIDRVEHVLLEHNPFGMWQSIANRVTRTPSYLYNLLKRNASLRSPDLAITLLMLPLVPLAALIELAAGLARRGGTIAVVARLSEGRRG